MTPGERWITRGGATVEVLEIRRTGLTVLDRMGRPLREAKLIVCQFVRYADGTVAPADQPRQFAVHEDGFYSSGNHPLDLTERIVVRAA